MHRTVRQQYVIPGRANTGESRRAVRAAADQVIESCHDQLVLTERKRDCFIAKQLAIPFCIDSRQRRLIDSTPVFPVAEDGELAHRRQKSKETIEDREIVRTIDRIASQQEELRAELSYGVSDSLLMSPD
jgi:hypothetical protein